CMKDCTVSSTIRSSLPEPSRNVHGNIQEQNRTFGEIRGVDTSKPASTTPISAISKEQRLAAATPVVEKPAQADGLALAKQYACVACHGVSNKIVGPGFNEVAVKYKNNAAAMSALMEKIKNGSSGSWGAVAMP